MRAAISPFLISRPSIDERYPHFLNLTAKLDVIVDHYKTSTDHFTHCCCAASVGTRMDESFRFLKGIREIFAALHKSYIYMTVSQNSVGHIPRTCFASHRAAVVISRFCFG
jgi:hypothetical protein